MKGLHQKVKHAGGIGFEIALGVFLLTTLLTAWSIQKSHATSAAAPPEAKMKGRAALPEALLPVQGTVPCDLTCPPDVIATSASNLCGANVNYAPPASIGNCGTIVCSPPSGGFFNVGTTPVTCSSLDGTSCNTIFGLSTGNVLVKFSPAFPNDSLGTIPISGLPMGESIEAIDFRPADGTLYGLGITSRLYTINTTTGAATAVSASAFSPALSGNAFGFDFNPTVDRIRVVSDADQNIRLNPVNGTVAGSDTNLAYAAGDPNFGQNPSVVGSAYTNNFIGTTTTTLYGIDSSLDILVRQGGVNVPPGTPSPNTGQLFTVGPLGVDTATVVGFDISACDGTAYATLVQDGASRLYRINLTTGAATLVGSTPVSTLIGMAVGFRVETCSFNVIVQDQTAPVLTCPSDIAVVGPQSCGNSSGVQVTFATPSVAGGTLSDNCGFASTTAVCSPASGSIFAAGTTTVTCTAMDTSGNTGSCSFTVSVFNACLQDDSKAANVLLFSTVTGDYRFCCGGTVFTGRGSVTAQGCIFTLQHNTLERRVFGKIDFSARRGNGSLQSPPGTTLCTISDTDTRNNNCQCTALIPK